MLTNATKVDYPSDSSPDTVHTVNIYDDGRISCSCRGFRSPNKCWHVRKEAEKRGKTLDITTWGATLGPDIDPNAPPVEEPARVVKPRKTKSKQATLLDGDEPAAPLSPVQPTFLPSSKVNGFIESMCASALRDDDKLENYQKPGHVLEIKYDGHRREIEVSPDGIWAWARSGKSHILPKHIIAKARKLAPGTYDGELYWPGGTSTDVTRLDIQHELKLVLFDMLRVGNQSCMDLPSTERRALLEVAFTNVDGDDVAISPQFPVTRDGLEAIWAAGGEGAIIKDTKIRYQPGKRVREWIKFVRERSVIVTITGFEEGSLGPHSVILGVDKHGVTTRCKTLNDAWRAMFLADAGKYIGRSLVMTYREKTRDKGRYKHGMAFEMVPEADHILD